MSKTSGETEPFALLRIKFQRPRLREDLVSRPRLLKQLHGCLWQHGSQESVDIAPKLILVSAPAGYGKTTALGQWIDNCPFPSAWLSLDRADSDLNVFLTYFTAVIQTVYPNACLQTSSLLRTPKLPPQEYLAITLANELADLPDKLLLVLDDFHLIEGEAVPKLVTALLDFLPPKMCLAIATRQDPNLPLIRILDIHRPAPFAQRFRRGVPGDRQAQFAHIWRDSHCHRSTRHNPAHDP